MSSECGSQVEKTLKSLKKNTFDARLALNGKEAKKLTLDLLPQDALVGIGDSATLRQISVINQFEERGTKVINPFGKELTDGPQEVPSTIGNHPKNPQSGLLWR